MKLVTGLLVLAIGCGGGATGHDEGAPDTGAADSPVSDAPVSDAPVSDAPSSCELRHSQTSAQLLTATDAFIAHINESGASAYVDHPDVSSVHIKHVHVDLPAAVDIDPRPAILEWLGSLRDTPVEPGEYAPSPERRGDSPKDGFVAGFVRTRIGSTRFGDIPLEGFTVTMQANGAVWRVGTVTITPAVFFATDGDARVHQACAPPPIPDATSIRAFTFRGAEFDHCNPVGKYEYQPDADDRIEWAGAPWGDGVLWTTGANTDGTLAWVPQRGARLMIAKSNYWDRIAYADCYCHAEKNTGFSLIVDALTGRVLRYTPAVNCVVC